MGERRRAKGVCLSKRKHVHTSARWEKEARKNIYICRREGRAGQGATAAQGHPLNSWCEYKVNKNKNIKSKFAFANKSEGNQLLTGEVFMVQCVSPLPLRLSPGWHNTTEESTEHTIPPLSPIPYTMLCHLVCPEPRA